MLSDSSRVTSSTVTTKYNIMVFFYDIEISLRFISCVEVCGPMNKD